MIIIHDTTTEIKYYRHMHKTKILFNIKVITQFKLDSAEATTLRTNLHLRVCVDVVSSLCISPHQPLS